MSAIRPQAGMRRRTRRSGAVAVEFALVMVMGFLPMLFAIIDWSIYFFQATVVQTELWSAARLAVSYDHSVDGVCPNERAETALTDALNGWNFSGASIEANTGSDTYGEDPPQLIEQLTVTVTVPFTPILGLVPVPATMGGSATVPLEVQVGC